MKARVEFLSDCLDGFYTDVLKFCHQLFVDTVHTVYERILFGFLGNRCQASFKIIYTVKAPSGKEYMFPGVDAFLKERNPPEGYLLVTPIPGLLDDDFDSEREEN